MPKLPSSVVTEPIPGLKLMHRGKVRDTYELFNNPDKLLVVASDRLSIFDFVLPALVPQKGAILTAMNIFWRTMIHGQFGHDLIAYGKGIDEYLPPELRGNPEIQKQASVVRKLEMCDCEAIVRGYLTGSGLKAYTQSVQWICGHRLPPGLEDGDRLPFPIFTPSTKAEEGHDEHVSADSVAEKYGAQLERKSLQLYQAAGTYAYQRGIILADTKFEWGGSLFLADEVLTPDSSRFWDEREWRASQAKSPRKSPTAFDKQFVREWGKTLGIDKLDPSKLEDVERVHGLEVPAEVIARTTQIYRYIFWRLTGRKLEAFQRKMMGLDAKPPLVKIEIVAGSESDSEQMRRGLLFLDQEQQEGTVQFKRHVISCHRNLKELANYAHNLPDDVIVVAGAGMAAALPGMLKTLLINEGKAKVPVIGVGFNGKTEDANLAARLSIEQLPGQPVVLDPEGKAYAGPNGFFDACRAAVMDEFLPAEPPANKPALFDLPLTELG